jgi:hypothetical protein
MVKTRHRIAEALSQRTGGGLHAGRAHALGVAWRGASPLPEIFQIVHGELVAVQVQERIQQHGPVARGQDEAVPPRPVGLLGIVAQKPVEEDKGPVGHPHGHSRVSAVGLLNCVHRQHADGVGGLLLQLLL